MTSIPPTDFDSFVADLSGRSYREALPAALSDPHILTIACYFRKLEQAIRHEVPHELSLSAPLALLTHVLLSRSNERGISSPLHCSLHDAMRFCQVYQVFLEREMITRVVEVSNDYDENDFMAAIDHEIDRLSNVHVDAKRGRLGRSPTSRTRRRPSKK